MALRRVGGSSRSAISSARKRPSASTMSLSEDSCHSSVLMRKLSLSWLIQPWTEARISSSLQCSAAMWNTWPVGIENDLPRLVCHRLILVRSARAGIERWVPRDRLEPFHALPAQVIQHPAVDALQELGVSPLQEVDDHLPLRPLLRPRLLKSRLPAPPGVGQVLVRVLKPDLLSDRPEQCPFLVEEESLVRLRSLFRVHDPDRPRLLALDEDRFLEEPRGLLVPIGPGREALQLQARLAHLGILPARRDDLQDPREPGPPWQFVVAQDLPHLVEAAEFLRPLLEVPKDLFESVLLSVHFRITPLPVRPSTRTSSGSRSWTCLRNRVSFTTSCRDSQDQSIPPSAAACLTVK